jgi:hypothetical protein
LGCRASLAVSAVASFVPFRSTMAPAGNGFLDLPIILRADSGFHGHRLQQFLDSQTL